MPRDERKMKSSFQDKCPSTGMLIRLSPDLISNNDYSDYNTLIREIDYSM